MPKTAPKRFKTQASGDATLGNLLLDLEAQGIDIEALSKPAAEQLISPQLIEALGKSAAEYPIGSHIYERLADEGHMLTKEEFLEELREQGTPLTETNLSRWQELGLIKKPVRVWYRGATRALYFRADLLRARSVKALLDAGYRRDQIGPMSADMLTRPGAEWFEELLQYDPPPGVTDPIARLVDAYTLLFGDESITKATITLYDDDGTPKLSLPISFTGN